MNLVSYVYGLYYIIDLSKNFMESIDKEENE